MLHAYRLNYRLSEHTPPQLWEWQQLYVHTLIMNARTFDRRVVQWYFEGWEDWLPEYRQLIIEVQEIYEEQSGHRMAKQSI